MLIARLEIFLLANDNWPACPINGWIAARCMPS
jgi:hypothetical protein